jgi:hypothetical protein
MEKKLTIVIETFIDDTSVYRTEDSNWQSAEESFYSQMNNFEKGQARQEEIREC